MTITQTVEIPASREITLKIPLEVPQGKAQVEVKVIPFAKEAEKPEKIRLTKEMIDGMIENSPHTRALLGILSDIGDIDLDKIRMERLAKHL